MIQGSTLFIGNSMEQRLKRTMSRQLKIARIESYQTIKEVVGNQLNPWRNILRLRNLRIFPGKSSTTCSYLPRCPTERVTAPLVLAHLALEHPPPDLSQVRNRSLSRRCNLKTSDISI